MEDEHVPCGNPDRIAAALERQCDELDMLVAVLGDAVSDLEGTSAAISERRQALLAATASEKAVLPSECLRLVVRICDEAPVFIPGRGVDSTADRPLTVTFTLPPGYPETASPLWMTDMPQPLTSHSQNELLRAVNSILESNEHTECLLQLIEFLRGEYLDLRANEAAAAAEAEAEQRVAEAEATARSASDMATQIANERVLGRRCVYYHHILGIGKRQCIASWARQLGINGFAKIGYPGILIVEGPECGIVEYIRGLQQLRWKLMVVRGEERVEVPSGKTLDAVRVIPNHGVVEMSDASEIAGKCRDLQLEELFLTSMKKYRVG